MEAVATRSETKVERVHTYEGRRGAASERPRAVQKAKACSNS